MTGTLSLCSGERKKAHKSSTPRSSAEAWDAVLRPHEDRQESPPAFPRRHHCHRPIHKSRAVSQRKCASAAPFHQIRLRPLIMNHFTHGCSVPVSRNRLWDRWLLQQPVSVNSAEIARLQQFSFPRLTFLLVLHIKFDYLLSCQFSPMLRGSPLVSYRCRINVDSLQAWRFA